MTTVKYSPDFLAWHSELRQLALKGGCSWLISTTPEAHLAAYEQGLSPEEELAELVDLAQWRGCGCGGS